MDQSSRVRGLSKGTAMLGALTSALVIAGCVPEQPGAPTETTVAPETTTTTTTVTPQPPADTVWAYTKETFNTNVQMGYQLGFDDANRKVYLSDAYWARSTRNLDTGAIVQTPGTGKLVEFDAATRSFVKNHDYTGLTVNNGTRKESDPFDWSTAAVTATSLSAASSHFSPYGVEIDGTTTYDGVQDATIITTTARQTGGAPGTSFNYGGGLVIYRASQGAPTDADRVWAFDDGSPMFNGVRRIAVNTTTHKAYVTNLGNEAMPGFVAVIDLPTKTLEARVQIPAESNGGSAYPGVVGIAIDEENNIVYAGSINGTKVFAFDADEVNTTNAKDLDINDSIVTELPAVVGGNARPTYDPSTEQLYVASYPSRGGAGHIVVLDADQDSPTYGQETGRIEGAIADDGNEPSDITTNSVVIDGERNLLFSADLGARVVNVYDSVTLDKVLTLPTSGNALNMAIDPVTKDLWVSNFSSAAKVDVFTVHELEARTASGGAKYYAPTSVYEGRPIAIVGKNWLNYDGTLGSVAGIKYNRGETVPSVDLGLGMPDVWGIANADTTGAFAVQTPFPSASNANVATVAGQTLKVHLLTGALGQNDQIRNPAFDVQVLSAR